MSNENKIENYTKFPNLVLEALMKAKLSGSEWNVIMMIIRKTEGFHKEWDRISLAQFAKHTGLYRSHASRAVKALEARNIIRVDREGWINKYMLNKKCGTWIPEGVTKIGNSLSPKMVTKLLPKQVNTKEKIKLLKKEDYIRSLGVG